MCFVINTNLNRKFIFHWFRTVDALPLLAAAAAAAVRSRAIIVIVLVVVVIGIVVVVDCRCCCWSCSRSYRMIYFHIVFIPYLSFACHFTSAFLCSPIECGSSSSASCVFRQFVTIQLILIGLMVSLSSSEYSVFLLFCRWLSLGDNLSNLRWRCVFVVRSSSQKYIMLFHYLFMHARSTEDWPCRP